MMGNLVNFIREVPIGVWLIFPILLTGLFTFMITQDRRKTWQITLWVVLIIGVTVGFYFWRLYLIQHFVGRFDMFGLPTQLYRSGLYILLDAWPIWIFPTAIAMVITAGGYRQFNRGHFIQPPSATPLTHDMSLQLEVQKLKQQLLIAKEKLHQARISSPAPSKMQQTKQDNIQRDLHTQVHQLHQQNQQLQDHVTVLENDLARAKSLIERLLDDHLDTDDSP